MTDFEEEIRILRWECVWNDETRELYDRVYKVAYRAKGSKIYTFIGEKDLKVVGNNLLIKRNGRTKAYPLHKCFIRNKKNE